MTGKRLHLPAVTTACLLMALLLAPAVAQAQRATGTLIVRVEESGMPAAGVDVAAVVRRSVQHIGTTGSSGLVAVEELRVEIDRGTRVGVALLNCGTGQTALLIPQYESLAEVPAGCEQIPAGSFFWGQTERVVVLLDGSEAVILETRSEELRSALSGWRFQGSFLFTALQGEDFETEKDGIGADGKLFYLWESGLGAGIGGSWTKHDVTGIGSDLNKWSAYLEPRYTLTFSSTKLRPHVLARASYNWFAYDGGETQSGRLGESGFGFGGGIGAAYPVAGWLALDVGVYLGYLSVSADYSGTTYTRSGSELQLTGGLRFF